MTEAQQSFPWQTVGGYAFYEVLSALQKSIRRGLEEDALFWATELYLSGYEIQAWRRLCIIASEDIGLANPPAFTEVRNLYLEWKEESKLHLKRNCTSSLRFCCWCGPPNPESWTTR